MQNDDDLIQARIPFNDPETGEQRELLMCRKTDSCLIVPSIHVQELIAFRKAVPPYRNQFGYQTYQPTEKWRFFLMGMVAGGALVILAQIVKTLFIK